MKTLRTICTAWTLIASVGCYQGLDGDRGAPAADDDDAERRRCGRLGADR
jgi:hypothetical protein